MSLIPYEPFRQLANMRREFDRLFTDFPSSLFADHHLGSIKVDVYETENEVIASCEIPGLENKDDVQVTIEGNMLTISGTIKRAQEIREEQMHRRERYVGRFHRSLSLPCPVSQEGVKATYKNGVLEIVMPKKKEIQGRRINIDFH